MKNNRGGTIVLHLDFLSLCNAFGDSLRVKAAAQHLERARLCIRSCTSFAEDNLRPHERNFSRPRER